MLSTEQIRALPAGARTRLLRSVTPRVARGGYVPHEPTAKQRAFLLLDCREALFGGSAGGGKSDALLMAALQYVDVPGYAALILRRTYPQLTKSEGLVPRAHEWLSGTDAKWNDARATYTFPSGARLEFGHLQIERDKYNYQGAAYQTIVFDELTQFEESQYLYLFSRHRRLEGSNVPLRMRAGSNPGGTGHEWVKQRFIVEGRSRDRVFVPARLSENPHLDRESYMESLAELDPVTRAQLLSGDWSARTSGSLFKREWFEIVDAAPAEARAARGWDFAATEPTAGTDPDYTVGTRMSVTRDGIYYVCDVRRDRLSPRKVEALVRVTAEVDGRPTRIRIEQEPGSAGKITIDHYKRNVLPGWSVTGHPPTGDKVTRAAPFSAQCEAGNVKLVRGPWIGPWLDELESFPDGSHDDQVDSVVTAFDELRSPRAVGVSNLIL